MSWDAVIFNKTGLPASFENLPDGWKPAPIGTPKEVKTQISEVIEVDWSSPSYGTLVAEEFVIEFNLGKGPILDTIGLRVVGGGNPMPVLVGLCRSKDWALFDIRTSELIKTDQQATKSWGQFTEWRDRVMKGQNSAAGDPAEPDASGNSRLTT
jgi:hypothetical protein